MLSFVVTDAAIEPGVLDVALRDVLSRTFNCITVDGDSSTNDTLLVLANGASGAKKITEAPARTTRNSSPRWKKCARPWRLELSRTERAQRTSSKLKCAARLATPRRNASPKPLAFPRS